MVGVQGPIVQSIISLTSSLVVKMLTVLVSTISNSQELLLKKMWVAFANAQQYFQCNCCPCKWSDCLAILFGLISVFVFANAKATHIFFSKNVIVYSIFNDQSFNDTLTNDIVSFEQLGPDVPMFKVKVIIFWLLLLMINYNYYLSTVIHL